jgi:hypothetical protein
MCGCAPRVPPGGQSRSDWLPACPPHRWQDPGPLAHGGPGLRAHCGGMSTQTSQWQGHGPNCGCHRCAPRNPLTGIKIAIGIAIALLVINLGLTLYVFNVVHQAVQAVNG